jgi:hypothetical protein
MPYHKYETQSTVENSSYELYRDTSIITERSIQSNRPDIVILDSTIKEAYWIDISIPNSPNFHSTITEWLQKYNDLQEDFIGIWQMKTAHIITLVLSTTGVIPNKSHEVLKLFNLRLALYILVQKSEILNICSRVRMFLAEQWINSWSVTTILFENQPNCCEIIDDDDDNWRTSLVKRTCKMEILSGSVYMTLEEKMTSYLPAKWTVFLTPQHKIPLV